MKAEKWEGCAAQAEEGVLEENGCGSAGEFIGLDVKAMRTQTGSREIFQHLVEKVRTLDRAAEQAFIAARDYEGLELFILKHLLGVR